MDLLEDLKMSLLNFNFVMIYVIHKMLALLKSNLNCLKYSIFEWLFKEHNKHLFCKKSLFFPSHMESLDLEEKDIINYIRSLFRLQKKN